MPARGTVVGQPRQVRFEMHGIQASTREFWSGASSVISSFGSGIETAVGDPREGANRSGY
ncbi:MAG: hypothetical protein WC993_02500 [Methanoculleus sp.]